MDPLSQAFQQTFGSTSSSIAQNESTYWPQNTANVVTYQQLSGRYAYNVEDFNELGNLLNSWNLGELYTYFTRKYIFKY